MGSPHFLLINGWPVPVQIGTASETPNKYGNLGPAFTNRPNEGHRGIPRELKGTAFILNPDDADCLEGLLAGRGHHFPFNDDAFSEAGLGPEAGSAYTMNPRTTVVTGAHGAGYITVSGTLVYDTQLPAARWTVLYWRTVTGTPAHIVVRSDGAKWLNGVRADLTTTTELTVSLGAVALTAGNYDDLVVLPFLASDAFVEAFFRWTKFAAFYTPLDSFPDDLAGVAAIVVNSTTYVRGVVGKAAQFSIAANRLSYTGSPVISTQTEFSWEFWVMRESAFAPTAQPRAMAKGGGAPNWEISLDRTQHTVNVGIIASLDMTAGVDPSSRTTATITPDVWHHVVVTWLKGEGTLRVYINGNEARYVSQTSNAGATPVADAGSTLFLGNIAATTQNLGGRLDEVRLYQRVLTPREVFDHYAAGRINLPLPMPRPFSSLPALEIYGAAAGWKNTPVATESGDQAVTEYSDDGTWRNNARAVPMVLTEKRVETDRVLAPVPWAQWLMDERYFNAAALTPAHGGFSDATRAGAPAFVVGPALLGRGLNFILAGQNIDVTTEPTVALFGKNSLTVLAWVRRTGIGTLQTLLDLSITAAPLSKVLLTVTAANLVSIGARGASADALVGRTSVAAFTSVAVWNLIGGSVDLKNDRAAVFINDVTYEEGAAAFPSLTFTAEAAGGNLIAENNSGINRWNGRIASIALYDRVLTPEEIRVIYRLGRVGVLS